YETNFVYITAVRVFTEYHVRKHFTDCHFIRTSLAFVVYILLDGAFTTVFETRASEQPGIAFKIVFKIAFRQPIHDASRFRPRKRSVQEHLVFTFHVAAVTPDVAVKTN